MMVEKIGLFQKLAPYLLWLVIFWAFFGRLFFDAGGWLVIVMFFTALPVAVGYAIAFMIVLLVRQRKVGYRFNTLTTISVATMLISGFVYGFTIVDGGDTQESIASVLTRVAGTGFGSPLSEISTMIAAIAALVAVVSAIVSLVFISLRVKAGR